MPGTPNKVAENEDSKILLLSGRGVKLKQELKQEAEEAGRGESS
jgi:hypothetical protein